MIRCRKCGITYKDDATLCLRCMNPLPKPAGKVTARKPVRKEVLDKIIAEKKPKNTLIATATPPPRKVLAKFHNNTPSAETEFQADVSQTSPVDQSFLEKTTSIEDIPEVMPASEILSPDVFESNMSAKISTTESISSVTHTMEPVPTIDTAKEKNPIVAVVTKVIPTELTYKQELDKVMDSIKELNPRKTIEDINPLFGEIRVDEVEKLFNFVSNLDNVNDLYARSQQRILFDRGYVLESGFITHLNIFNIGISVLPPNLDSFSKLKLLDLEKNNFEAFPEGLYKITTLESINVSENKLKDLPSSISKLTHLKSLQLYDNEISSLPQELRELKNLTYLDLRGNKLTDKDLDVIYELTNLKYLSLESNNLRSLSDKIDKLSELEILLLGHNPIDVLPDISNLKNLKELSLYGTNLKYVPESILFIPGLQKLDIWNTGIKSDDWLLIELKEAGVSINMSGI